MAKGKVLVIGSNATRIEVQGGGTVPAGNYLNETVVPVMAFNRGRLYHRARNTQRQQAAYR